jgi:hypothetical protein
MCMRPERDDDTDFGSESREVKVARTEHRHLREQMSRTVSSKLWNATDRPPLQRSSPLHGFLLAN